MSKSLGRRTYASEAVTPVASSGSTTDTGSSMAATREELAKKGNDASTYDTPVLARLGLDVRTGLEAAGVQGGGVGRGGLGQGDPTLSGGERTPGGDRALSGGKDFSKARRFGMSAGHMVGGRHRSSFQGEGHNARSGVDGRNFGGDGKGNAMSGAVRNGSVVASNHTMNLADRQMTGTDGDHWSFGMSREGMTMAMTEEKYQAMVGEAGYEATKDMSPEERKAYWEAEAAAQRKEMAGRPREDDDGGGTTAPMGRGDVIRDLRGIGGRRGGAGGAGDGRGGGGGGGGGPVSRDVLAPKGDRVEKESDTGTLNLDAVFGLDPLVNPGAQ